MHNRLRQPHHFFRFGTLLKIFILLLVCTLPGNAQLKELQLKAMFLEAAIRFISWPAPAGDSTISPRSSVPDTTQFTIGIFKGSPLTPYLKKVFEKKTVKDVPVTILELDNLKSVSRCNLILISDKQKKLLPKIISITRNNPILTVSENPELLEQGIILSIVTEHRKIECYINKAEADSSRFKISHHLLKKSTLFIPKDR